MKSENIITALNDIDPELVEDAEGTHKRTSVTVFLKWGAVAAVLCLICAFALDYIFPIKPDIPVYKDALYSASEIADFFGGTYSEGGTSSYEKIYVPSLDYLDFHCAVPIPQYLPIYQLKPPISNLNQEDFDQFASARIERISRELGIAIPSYTIEETPLPDDDKMLVMRLPDMEGYYLSASQTASSNNLHLQSNSKSQPEICLGDVRIEVDQSQSDEQIIASLSEIKEKLFSVFGVEFSDIKILRVYDDDGEHGVTRLHIYFYNEADHPLNAVTNAPHSDYINLEFRNYKHSLGGIVSDTVLRDVWIYYRQYRINTSELYAETTQAPTISLQEAEALLYNGYVFGGHSCQKCMAMQDKVNFYNYDFVDIVYIQSAKPYDGPKNIIPFYAFHKKIGTAENGNEIYAKTYVPAIKVSGYEEYFKSQESQHKDE